MFALHNPATGKEVRISQQKAKEVFNVVDKGVKKFICLPCSGDVKIENANVTPVFHIQKVQRKRKMPGTCVARMGGIGDLILLTPGLLALKRRHPKVALTFATLKENVSFMKSLGFIDRCIPITNLGKYEFEKLIDLRFAVEPPQLGQMCKGTWEDYTTKDRSDVFEELLGVYPCKKRFQVPVNGKSLKEMKKITNGSGKTVLLNACMIAPARSIVPKYVLPLSSMITKAGATVILTGVSQPWNALLKLISGDGIINMIDQTSLPELIALCSLVDLVVTPDTGTIHIAGGLGTRTIGLFGNIHPRTRVSYYSNVKPLYFHGSFHCQPCGDLHPCLEKAEDGSKCMALLKPKVIFEKIKEELS